MDLTKPRLVRGFLFITFKPKFYKACMTYPVSSRMFCMADIARRRQREKWFFPTNRRTRLPHADPEERKRYRQEYAARNREKTAEYQKAYRQANAEKAKNYNREYQKEYYHIKLKLDPEYVQKRRDGAAKWYLENTERAKLTAKAHCTKRRSLIDKVTPAWADMESVKAIYALAMKLTEETGIKHEVDHIVPLRGKNVQGLHCEANLRVITMAENRRKGSSHAF